MMYIVLKPRKREARIEMTLGEKAEEVIKNLGRVVVKNEDGEITLYMDAEEVKIRG